MSKHCALLLSVALLLVSTGRAETVVVRADRRAVLVELDESTAKKPPVPWQAARPSPVK